MRTLFAGAMRAALIGLLSLSAQAATTFNITTTSMANAVDGVCTLQEALEVLRTGATVNECVVVSPPFTVNLSPGTYTVATGTDTSNGTSAARVNFDTTLTGNGATLAGSAGLRAFLVDAPLTISDLTITGFAGANDGTVFVVTNPRLNLERVDIHGNGSAGTPTISVQCACELNIHRSALYGNAGSSLVSMDGNSAIANIANSTLSAPLSLARTSSNTNIYLSSTTVISGIVAGPGSINNFSQVGHLILGGFTCSFGGSLGVHGPTFGGGAGPNPSCGGNPAGERVLAPNGGTVTYALTRGLSNAVDAFAATCSYRSTGNNPLFVSGAAVTVDQRGEPRTAALCDVGAYESQFPVMVANGAVGTAYSATPLAGATLTLLSGALPPGITIAGGTLQGTPTGSGGSFTFELQGDRAGGLQDFAQYTVTITAAPPPDTAISLSPANPSANTAPIFAYVGTDGGAGFSGIFQCSLDGAPFTPCGATASYSGLSQGSHTFQVRAVDDAAAVDPTPASYTWVIDSVAPDTTITVMPPAITNVDSTQFEYTGSDPGGSGVVSFECQIDALAFTGCPFPAGVIGVGDGPHTFRVRAIDAAGNVDSTPATYTWTIDTTVLPPVITSPAAASTVPPNPPLSGTGEAGALVTVREGAATVCTATVAVGGAWSCATTLGDGAHTIDAIQLDTAGNTSAASATLTFTVLTPVNSYTAPSATGTGMITAVFVGGGAVCTYGVRQYIPVTGHAASPPAGSAPPNLVFPHGLFDFTATGCTPGSTITMSITYPTALQPGTLYYKYGPTPSDPAPHWYVLPSTVVGNTVTFTIVDGGLGDDDLAANGTIVDQGGPGFPIGGPGSGIPTLSEWAMLLLIAGMLAVGLRRRFQ